MFTKNQLPCYYFGSDNDQTNIQTRPIASKYNRSTRNEVNIERDTILTPVLTKDEGVFKSLNTTIDELHLSEPNLPIAVSPTSSLATNKKLEWDSGADIGYNFHDSLHRKCKSFPLLNMDFSISRINSDVSIDTDLTDKNCQLTSKNSKVSKVNKNIQVIKHSTPHDRNRDEVREGVHNKNESMQTSLVHYCSKSIQTDFDVKLHNKSQQTETLKRTPTDFYSNSSSTSKSSFEYIPGSNLGSKCSIKSNKSSIDFPCPSKASFRSKSKNSHSSYEVLEIKSPTTETNASSNSQSNCFIHDLKSVENEVIIFSLDSVKDRNSSKSSSTASSSEDSISSPLSKVISTQHSKILVDDVDHSLRLLQQFIKSDNYNTQTKKYYAKKIISKLIQNKYSGDSSSDSQSVASTQNEKSECDSVKSVKIISSIYKKETLQNDGFDYTNRETKYKKEELISENQSSFVESDKTQKEELNARKECDCANNDKLPPKYKFEIKTHLQEISNKLKEFKLQNNSGESSNSSTKNWRDNKTISEKLLEAKYKSKESSNCKSSSKIVEKNSVEIQTDSNMTQRAQDEKSRQLSWIKKEINYLIRLQSLLENNELPSANSSIQSINEHFDSRKSQLKNCIHHLSSQCIKSDSTSDSQNLTNTSSSLEKLSKFLTNDQLKFYINNIAPNHRDSCECCNILFVKSTVKNEPVDNSRRCSYNSHCYPADDITARSCYSPNKKSPETGIIFELQPTAKFDAETQCTTRSSSETTDSSETQTDDAKETTLIFENNILKSETSESSNKEYCMCKKRRNSCTATKCECHPNPYFLTFEEGSTFELCQCAPKRKPLETVTIKVPKFGNKVPRKSNSYSSFTLEEYLKENRPDFVAAAEWRRRFLSNRIFQRPKLLFTSREMRQITLKSYRKLPEVQNKIKDCREQNQRRHNRIMANVFSKKLQKKTLAGQISLATSISVISTL